MFQIQLHSNDLSEPVLGTTNDSTLALSATQNQNYWCTIIVFAQNELTGVCPNNFRVT